MVNGGVRAAQDSIDQRAGRAERTSLEEIVILVPKAQANHFMQPDTDFRTKVQALREGVNKRFEAAAGRCSSIQW